MARDYKQEYQKALQGGWRDGVKKINVSLTGHYIDDYFALLEQFECKTLGEFLRNIIDGKLSVSKRF